MCPVVSDLSATVSRAKSGERFPTLLTPLTVGALTFKNRVFVTGHMTMMVHDGVPTAQQVSYYEARAKGGVALIVMEAAAVHPTGLRGRHVIDASSDKCVEGYARIVEKCGNYNCPLVGQLFHPGREMTFAADGSRFVTYAPSSVRSDRFRVVPRAMPEGLIKDVIQGYGQAALRHQKAGLVGSEIVASMGYLPSQFLNPRVNLRADGYGGSFENRVRIVREIIADIRSRCGDDFLVGIRIAIDEKSHDGLQLDEVTEICKALHRAGGVDYFSLISGSSSDASGSIHIVPPMAVENAYLGPQSAQVRKHLTVPVFLAGRINQPHEAERVLAEGQADMCGMTRATICDPELVRKIEAGTPDDIRACIGCNQACIGHEQAGYPISCIQHPETGREQKYGTIIRTTKRKKVMVAGAGPGGMKAATIAAVRGHEVLLYEASERVGGQARLAQMLPGRDEFGGLITNLERELSKAKVKVVTRAEVTRAVVEDVQPDTVVVATGATPFRPDIEVDDDCNFLDAWAAIRDAQPSGHGVVIADWRCDWIGLGLAEKFARSGCWVRLCVCGIVPGELIQPYVRDHWNGVIKKLGVQVTPYVRLFGADADTAYFQHTVTGEAVILEDVDVVISAQGHMPHTELEQELRDWNGTVHVIGDCLSPRTAEEAVLEGLKAAWEI